MPSRPTITLMQDGSLGPSLLYAVYLLVVLRGPDKKRQKRFSSARALIGSGAGADLVLSDRTVSSAHCEIRVEAQGVRIRDLGSKNGVLLDTHRIQDAWLESGDRITLGETVLKFTRLDEASAHALPPRASLGRLRGSSVRMRQLYSQLLQAAGSDAPVLLVGESGTGKELAAEALVQEGPRRDRPFVVLDCAGLSPSLAETALFGHEQGAFTGATERVLGVMERAHGGTLFLDELESLTPEVQPRLLGALERGTIQRVGGSAQIAVDVRVIAATHPDLEMAVNRGAFRSDLFFRLAVLVVRLPMLKEHPEDIPELVAGFLDELGTTLPAGTLQQLCQRDFPGNVRELRNAVRRATVGLDDVPISLAALPRVDLETPFRQQKDLLIAHFESTYLRQLLDACGGNIAEVARRSGINRVHLYEMLERRGLKGPAR